MNGKSFKGQKGKATLSGTHHSIRLGTVGSFTHFMVEWHVHCGKKVNETHHQENLSHRLLRFLLRRLPSYVSGLHH